MDHKLFLEKLSEVAEWEYRNHLGITNHNYRADEDVKGLLTPQYIYVTRLKTRGCDIEEGYHANTVIKNYTYNKKVFLVERCPDCGYARTRNSGWFEITHISNLPAQGYYKQFGGGPKVYNKKPAIMEQFESAAGYIIQESEFGVIRRLVDK